MSTSQTFADGDKVVHGQQGEVAGVMRGRTAGGHAWSPLAVRFSGNKGHVGLRVAEVRRPLRRLRCHPRRVPHTRDAVPAPEPTRERAQVSRHPPPPLDGGFKVGEKLFYTWPSRTFEHKGTTYKLVQGQQGEVMGPGTGQHEQKGTGLAMLFPGNKSCVDCVLAKVSRLRAASAAIPCLLPHATLLTPQAAALPPLPLPRRPHCKLWWLYAGEPRSAAGAAQHRRRPRGGRRRRRAHACAAQRRGSQARDRPRCRVSTQAGQDDGGCDAGARRWRAIRLHRGGGQARA